MKLNVIRKLSFAALVLGTTALTGCANFGIGNPEYKCTGIPEETDQGGVKCVSARKVYELTEQPGPVTIQPAEEEAKATGDGWWGGDETESDKGKQKESTTIEDLTAESNHPLAASPINNDPIPLRSRAKIMRIWVAPWESTQGDLNVSGLVFTELEGRRWSIGAQEDIEAPSLTPLQTIQHTVDGSTAKSPASK